jgi:drug/metabolite transporter (DMT)-like permease
VQLKYLGALLLLGATWGASFLFIKIGVREMPPETLVMLRLMVAAVILLVILYARGLRLPMSWRMWRHFMFTGSIGLIVPYVLITWGEQSIPSGMAAILNATTPLFTVLFVYLGTRQERLTGLKLLGLAIGFVGVIVAVGVGELSLSSASLQGQLAVLVAAACYGLNGVYSKRAFNGISPLVAATGQMLAGTLLLSPIALARHGIPTPLPSAMALGSVLALGVLGTALAYILLYWLIEGIGATRSSMVTYLLPPFALLYGALFLSEPVHLNAVAGLALVVVGILLANGVLRSHTVSKQSSAQPLKQAK